MKKVKLIEEAVFESVETAQREVKFAKVNMIRTLIGTAFAVLSTILLLIALFGQDSQYYVFAALPAIPAYLIGGGIGKAVKAAWKITKIGWFLIPVFPADVLLAIAFFFLSLFVFFYLPIIFVGLNYVDHKRAFVQIVNIAFKSLNDTFEGLNDSPDGLNDSLEGLNDSFFTNSK
ncbi:MAG: hypothetical protein II709_08905, partial [Ruminococcus sp.]|nr:hypothetical protein [Ruminococcus sp.]